MSDDQKHYLTLSIGIPSHYFERHTHDGKTTFSTIVTLGDGNSCKLVFGDFATPEEVEHFIDIVDGDSEYSIEIVRIAADALICRLVISYEEICALTAIASQRQSQKADDFDPVSPAKAAHLVAGTPTKH